MSITIDAYTQEKGSGASLTKSFTIASGAVLYVGVMHGYDSSQSVITSVKYNNVDLTKVTDYAYNGDSNFAVSVWKLDNPDAGTHDIVVTYSDAVPLLSLEAISLLGADTSGSSGANGVNVATGSTAYSISKTITTTQDNSVIVIMSGSNAGHLHTHDTSGTNETIYQQQNNNLVGRYGSIRNGLLLKTTTTAGSQSPAFQIVGDSNGRNLGIAVVEVKEYVAPPVEPPVVDTAAATSITTEGATLNGEITDVGLENADERGFVWDTSSHSDPGDTAPESSDYASNWSESGDFSAETFDYAITGLDHTTTYYVRAFAHNSDGYAYGDEISFETETPPPFRFENIPGVVYSETDTQTIFAERLNEILDRLHDLDGLDPV